MDILQSVMDSSSHAMFTMDRQGIVTHINQQAKERFGLFNHSRYSHGAGRIEKGDLVILATSSMGTDDGNLTAADLAVIGIREHRLRQGDMLAAVGVYGDTGVKPVYKFLREGDAATLGLEVTFQGIPISIQIKEHNITVAVRSRVYSIDYFTCIGQLVVLDSRKQTKFWEEKGYSARKEGIGSLLRGGSFVAKGPNEEICVVGYHFREFFEGELFESCLQQVLAGEASAFADMDCQINGYELLASILPIHDAGQIAGVIVKFRIIEDIRITIMERNTAIAAAERQYRQLSEHSAPDDGEDAIIAPHGNSAAIRAVRRRAYKLSQMDCGILITGEPGTGKSQLAQSIGRVQPRKGPFIIADCSAVDPAALDSILFGGVDGTPGLFRKADGGTLFLDEVGELPPGVQAKLLSVIQRREFTSPCSGTAVKTDVRLLVVAGRTLRDELEAGRFRQDLYYRLSAFALELPPLRERREDIYLVANELLEQICKQYHMPEKSLSGEAFAKLVGYDWPGNLRELENVLEGAAALSDSDIIYPEHIRLETAPTTLTLRQHMKQEERRYIQQVLAQCGGDRQQAMKLLDMSRSVFYDRLKEYDIH